MHKQTSRGLEDVAVILRKIYAGILVMLVSASFVAIYFLKPLLLPVILALLIAMILRPIQNLLIERVRVPEVPAAFLVVSLCFGAVVAGGYLLAEPASDWMEKLSVEGGKLKGKLENLEMPGSGLTEKVKNVAKDMDAIGKQIEEASSLEDDIGPSAGGDKEVMKVEVEESALSKTVIDYARDFLSLIASTTVLSVLFLAYGTEMSRRIQLTSIRNDENLLPAVAREVSRYLATVTAINLVLGAVIGLALWCLGLPNALLWGLMAALLNFVPYLGAIVGAGIVGFASLSLEEGTGTAVAVPLVYLAITAIEGNFVTPAILGRHFSVNPIMIFVWFILWSWLWGVPGGLVAVPVLMGVYIIMRGVPEFRKVANAIGLHDADPPENTTTVPSVDTTPTP